MNKDNYKNAVNQICASDKLKEKTLEKIKQRKTNKISYLKLLSSVAIIIIVISIGMFELNIKNNPEEIMPNNKIIATVKNDLPRFKNIEELKEELKENNSSNINFKSSNKEIVVEDQAVTRGVLESAVEEKNSIVNSATKYNNDYSTTNIQVDNVDEADIVKTDGQYIYYVTENKVFIVDANELKVISKIEIEEDKKQFSPKELFINKNKLIVLGDVYEYEEVTVREENSDELKYEETENSKKYRYSDKTVLTSKNLAKAIVYDISDKENLKIIREVGLDGSYVDSRMIGDNIYFISKKYSYYYSGIKDEEILPRVQDTVSKEQSKLVPCTDIIYFKETENNNYMLVGGFNINNDDQMNVETFFGANDNIYASENNLYLTQTTYDNNNYNTITIIYKFSLNNSQIGLIAKNEVDGYLNNQFSMDEYEGNLRLATTYTIKENIQEQIIEEADNSSVVKIPETQYSNRLYILDENLNEVSRIDDLAKDEKIYSVRFIGKIGYIVTFEEVDPLFVIDLSNPQNPEIKGQLKIPGYSSYLHPYDENHLIGIGYNTKSNGHGGITTDNMKMSMFDVSDLENPKEMFSIDIGNGYTHSEILYNHKSLFYKASEKLIGFPVTYNNKNEVILFKIDLEKGFERYAEIFSEKEYYNIQRIIYIKEILYILEYNKIFTYNLNTLEKIGELILD